MSALFPGSSDVDGFWRDILSGRDLMQDVPPSHWLVEDYYDADPAAPDKTYVRRGAFLSPVEFDPLEFGVPPNVVPATDTSQLLALLVAKRVLEDAAGRRSVKLDRERVSVILGTTSAQELVSHMSARLQRPVWVKSMREHGMPEDEIQALCDRIAAHYLPWQENTFPGLLGNVIAGRIANRMNLGGTNCVTDAACASSLAALSMAAFELWMGESDLVITGGVETLNDIFMYTCFSKTPALSPTEDCRPFSADADGTMLGEGLAMIALKRLPDAERDGDRVYAVIRGIGSSSDGRAKSIYAPVAEGQARALRRAYSAAGYGPETVELVEAHGTGTKAGDAAEYQGLQSVFDATGRKDRQWCALGSIKSQLGHTKSAAGIAGLFKAVLAVHHKVLPPTIKVTRPNPELGFEHGPFYLNTEARPWIRGNEHPRRASVSSFGFGGSNFHVTVEEYAGPAARARRSRSAPSELVLISATSPAALAKRCRADRPGPLAPLAWRSQAEEFVFDAPARLAVVAADEAELAAKLAQAAAAIESNPQSAFTTPSGIHYATAPVSGALALVFPGAGSQYVGMGADLAIASDHARAVWDATAGGLADVVFPRPAFADGERERQRARLADPEWARPAVALTSAAALAVVRALGLGEAPAAGLGIGERAASFADGTLDLEALLRDARACASQDPQQQGRFRERIEALYASGARVFLEVGPGSTLTSLLDEQLAGRQHLAVSVDRRGEHGVTALWNALARLAVAGVRFDTRALWEPYLPLPDAPQKKAVHALTISGANYGKPYPPPGGTAALPAPNPRRAVPEPVPEPAAPAAAAAGLWADLEDVQRETALTHTAYQRTAAAAHVAFLRSAEASLAALMGSTAELTAPAPTLEPPPRVTTPPAAVVPVVAAVPLVRAPQLKPADDVKALLLAVVAEKTGYPSEMLSLEMHVEADLGIDSIKRVEILSAMQERAPGLPVVRAADLAALQTLGQIVTFLDGDASPPHAHAPRARELPAVTAAE
jgi:acyl transferase domain-containing protein